MWKFTINLRWFLTVSIILASLNTISGEKDGPGCVRPQRFDYLILSVTNSGMEAQSQKPSSHSWTIHGLWPQIYGRRGFGYCCAPHQHEFLDRQDLGALEVTLKVSICENDPSIAGMVISLHKIDVGILAKQSWS